MNFASEPLTSMPLPSEEARRREAPQVSELKISLSLPKGESRVSGSEMRSLPVRVLLVGAAGRMGKTVLDLAQSDQEIEIAAQCDLGDSIEPAMKNCDVAIDFSQADSIDEICRAALQHGKPLVIGTTGHSQQQRKTIERQRTRYRSYWHRISASESTCSFG